MNTCTSQQILSICIQPKQDTPILGEDDNVSGNLGPYKDEQFIPEEQDIEGDHRNLIGESSDTESRAKEGLSGRTPQARLLGSESSSF